METEFGGLAPAAPAPGRDLARASAASFVAGGTSIVVALVRSKVAALALGPAGVGALGNLTLYLTWVTVMAAAVAGPGAVRALAAMTDGDQSRRHWLERYMFLGPLSVGLLLTIVTIVAAKPLSDILLGPDDLTFAPLLMSAAIPVAVLAVSYSQFLQARRRVGTIAAANIVTSVVSLPLAVALIVAYGLPGALLAVGAAFAIRLVAQLALSRGITPRGDWLSGLRIPQDGLRPVLAVGSAAAIVGIATMLGALLIRAEIVGTLGLATAGLYQPIAALSDIYLDALFTGAAVFLFPRLSELLNRNDRTVAERELGHGVRLTLALSVPLMLVVVGLSPLVIDVLYSAEFGDAAWPMSVQIAGALLRLVGVTFGAVLVPLSLTRAWVCISLGVVLLRYVGVVLLAPSLGLVGLSVASDVGWAVGAIATIAIVQRSGRLDLMRAGMRHLAMAGLMVLVVLVARTMSPALAAVVTAVTMALWLYVARRELAALLGSVADGLSRFPRASGLGNG